MREVGRYYPDILRIFESSFTDRHQRLKLSIDAHVDYLNKKQVMHNMITKHTKEGNWVNPANYLFSTDVNTSGRCKLPYDPDDIYVDGTHGFALGYKTSGAVKPIWLAFTGIAMLDEERNKITKTLDYKNAELLYPVIRQLQVLTKTADGIERPGKQEILGALRGLRWERLMISAVTRWAEFADFARVYLQPAEKCRWAGSEEFERYKLRYDVSAKRSGFKKAPSGYFVFRGEASSSSLFNSESSF